MLMPYLISAEEKNDQFERLKTHFNFICSMKYSCVINCIDIS